MHEFIATGFYVGRIGFAPGTLGTLLGIPIVYLFSFNRWTLVIALIGVFLIGLTTSKYVIETKAQKDPEEVVIDEIAGYIACFLLVEPSFKTYVLAFCLFRAVDILKPFPVNLFEQLPREYGVMLDDIAAGILTSIVLFLLLK